MIVKIISGAQTGVDRAALDFAIANKIAHGGWIPAGRRCENGKVPLYYKCQETPSSHYSERTSWNVRDADGTLIISRGRPSSGTAYTVYECKMQDKAMFICDLKARPSVAHIVSWIIDNEIKVLNVAGPRETKQPGIGREVHDLLGEVIKELRARETKH